MDKEGKITFGELHHGNMFIILLVPGGSQGSDWFLVQHDIYRKIVLDYKEWGTPKKLIKAEKWSTGEDFDLPDSTRVIRVA